MSDTLGIFVLLAIFTLIVGVVVHLLMNKSRVDNADSDNNNGQKAKDDSNNNTNKKDTKKKRALERMAQKANDDDDTQENNNNDAEDENQNNAANNNRRRARAANDNDDDGEGDADEPALNKKDQLKAQRKAERDKFKQEMEQQRDAQRQKFEERAEKQKRKDDERELARKEKEDAERRKKEDEEKRIQQDFDQWKHLFVTEETGTLDSDLQANSESLLTEFIEYVKNHKVVVLETLASHFNLKTQEAIERLRTLEEAGSLTGLMDDKGKYIYITQDEMQQVANFIKKRGRVSIHDISKESNRLIDLEKRTVKENVAVINLDDIDGAVTEANTTTTTNTTTQSDLQAQAVELDLSDLGVEAQ